MVEEESTKHNIYLTTFKCYNCLYLCRTKYLGGHSDILGGVLTARTEDLWTKLNATRMAVGNVMVID